MSTMVAEDARRPTGIPVSGNTGGLIGDATKVVVTNRYTFNLLHFG